MAVVGQRVLISGMGGELGSRVASLLENEPWVESLEGIDLDPPRRRLRRAVYHRIGPGDHDRIVDVVTRFDPHVLVHIAVWEPHSRANPERARLLTDDAATSILGAAAECRSLESIVVRSGTEIYGRARGSVSRPDESARINPTSRFGKMLAGIEHTAATIGDRIGVTVGALRLAPVIGPHVPSPLGRYLRMPAVPFSALADPPFAVAQETDAAAAFVAAARVRLAEPINVVAPGSITAFQAIRRGGRLPVPLFGPDWMIARGLSYLAGAPIPDHVLELMHRGRLADGGRAREVLGIGATNTTREVIDKLFSWPSVVHTPAREAVA
ncbi:MAG: NAD-dependent epimerase/dehydratase family protein [Ilumatobacteraceae bacterium]